ncbi:MAG TPA: histidine phosphatase family protein [Longilinea sp.]|nr:histidine phosphatase family protein [Longilinea sp.]
MTEIWFIRHGQTDWNVAHRFQGQIDTSLNDNGFAQARALAETLAGHDFAALYSSDIARARQTAGIISDKVGLPVQIEPRLREIGQGHWEDLTLEEVAMRYPDEMRAVIRDPAGTHAHGGESYYDIALRMTAAADAMTAAHPGQRILAVSHAVAIASIACVAQHDPLTKLGDHMPGNASPTILKWPPEDIGVVQASFSSAASLKLK